MKWGNIRGFVKGVLDAVKQSFMCSSRASLSPTVMLLEASLASFVVAKKVVLFSASSIAFVVAVSVFVVFVIQVVPM